MAVNKLFFCLHVYQPSLPHFHFKIFLYFIHDDEAKRANEHATKRIIYWPPFRNKVYCLYSSSEAILKLSQSVRGHSVSLIENGMRPIICNPGHICQK